MDRKILNKFVRDVPGAKEITQQIIEPSYIFEKLDEIVCELKSINSYLKSLSKEQYANQLDTLISLQARTNMYLSELIGDSIDDGEDLS